MDQPHSQHPAKQHKKHSKNVKEKIKIREEHQQYLRKVENKTSNAHADLNPEKCMQRTGSICDVARRKDSDAKLQEEHIPTIDQGPTQLAHASDGTADRNTQSEQKKGKKKEIEQPLSTVMQSNTVHSSDDMMEKHYIFRLKEKSSRFPQATFYCRLCNYHLDTIALCMKHWKEPRHLKLEELNGIMPPPRL
ncbi:terminal uridylyltransferase 4-like [Acanthaster planci]|uniref:Terminal uridylyltransferase 4-like n=1 Tax=Acanthaster planci TaxID=133434 RepID=A0A8B7Z8J6_ACAPL|nr:terminal uridylyltransferase 4-like [Acanthaster planci]XP_022101984.1 terminal uridylyltransferase 4-like [Acanthaster planci]XP_022101985.1 terminal uridylyltransferase 4-like [Acanthaster planci]XP_022101986.1 terminal uridylyltransferase 4-like [Acanthaster planci]